MEEEGRLSFASEIDEKPSVQSLGHIRDEVHRTVEDVEKLIDKSAKFDFVMRIPPLRWGYSFFKWLQRVKSRI